MNKKLYEAVFGFAVGDALGVPYEFRERNTFTCTGMIGGGSWGQPVGTWSDDTSMVLATCDSIRHWGRIFPSDIMNRFENWLCDGHYTAHGNVFDVGNTTLRAIDKYHNGTHWNECGERSNLSCGNGSLMRILPIAFLHEVNKQGFREVCGLTHKNEVCVEACAIYLDLLKFVADEKDLREVLQWEHMKHVSGYFHRLVKIWELPESEIKSTGYVVDTLEAAVWCFTTSRSYSEAVLKAVNLGGDTDTIAALTGALAALRWGYNSIPEEWVDKLANKELIENCLF